MKGYLWNALGILALVGVLIAAGMGLERFRRRGLQKWAEQQGGSFEAGGLLDGVPLPEAAAFDVLAEEKPTYHNVTRIAAPDASYVLAQLHRTYKDTKNNPQSASFVVAFVNLPGPERPAVAVHRPVHAGFLGELRGIPERTPLAVPGATPAFAAEFQVHPLSGAGPAAPDALARLLPPAVQEELLSSAGLIAGLQARSRTVRLQAVGRATGYPHAEVYAFARRLVAEWTTPR